MASYPMDLARRYEPALRYLDPYLDDPRTTPPQGLRTALYLPIA